MRFARLLVGVLCLTLLSPAASVKVRRRGHRGRSSVISNNRRLTVNSLITEPGTFEMEWYGAYDTNGDFIVPTTWKLTPGSGSGYFRRTEFSASFNALETTSPEDARVRRFSDHLTFAATTALPDIGPLHLAAAPIVTTWLRGNSGLRAGALLLGRVENDRSQIGFASAWTGATHSSENDPAGTFDLSIATGTKLARTGPASAFSPHVSVQWEKSTGFGRLLTFTEGIEMQINKKLAMDLSTLQVRNGTGPADYQIVLGVTWNLGKHSRLFR